MSFLLFCKLNLKLCNYLALEIDNDLTIFILNFDNFFIPFNVWAIDMSSLLFSHFVIFNFIQFLFR